MVQAARLDDEQFAGVGGFFVVLADGVDGLFDEFPHHAGGDGHRVVGAGHRQAGVVRRVEGRDLKLRHAAADDGLAVVGQLDAHIARRHAADQREQQLGFQHRLAGHQDVALDGGGDAHLHIVAGQRQVEALGFQVDALQHGDGRAVGDGAGHASMAEASSVFSHSNFMGKVLSRSLVKGLTV